MVLKYVCRLCVLWQCSVTMIKMQSDISDYLFIYYFVGELFML